MKHQYVGAFGFVAAARFFGRANFDSIANQIDALPAIHLFAAVAHSKRQIFGLHVGLTSSPKLRMANSFLCNESVINILELKLLDINPCRILILTVGVLHLPGNDLHCGGKARTCAQRN
jgi:hypothetical protein